MTKTSESLMYYTITWSVGTASLGRWFGPNGPVIGAVLGAACGMYICLRPQHKKDRKQRASKSS